MTTPFTSTRYEPPIPMLYVRFLRLDGKKTERLEAIVDTGADITIAPLSVMENLESLEVSETELFSQWHDPHPVILYLVDLEIETLRLPGIYVAGDATANEIILGRNVLNKLPLFLDGPKQQTEILDDATVKRLRDRRD